MKVVLTEDLLLLGILGVRFEERVEPGSRDWLSRELLMVRSTGL